ncbi:MAG: hypothetical protein QNI84_01995 [Henriciella sp.]|nr:hypothetical protein [Henriciella sp.]
MTDNRSKFSAARTLLIAACCAVTVSCASTNNAEPLNAGVLPSDTMLRGKVTRPVGLLFTGMDSDGDSVTSRIELIEAIPLHWARIDTASKGDVGAVSIAEWSQVTMGDRNALPNYLSFDADLNGRITRLEFEQRLIAEFEASDLNSDGSIGRSELLYSLPDPRQATQGELWQANSTSSPSGPNGGRSNRNGNGQRRPVSR